MQVCSWQTAFGSIVLDAEWQMVRCLRYMHLLREHAYGDRGWRGYDPITDDRLRTETSMLEQEQLRSRLLCPHCALCMSETRCGGRSQWFWSWHQGASSTCPWSQVTRCTGLGSRHCTSVTRYVGRGNRPYESSLAASGRNASSPTHDEELAMQHCRKGGGS